MNNWKGCKNILCIRADHMGDVLMSSPAIAALKETYDCRITVLTSSIGAAVCALIPEIDEVLTADLPWLKLKAEGGQEGLQEVIAKVRGLHFDGCIIFTVYSQSSLPAALMAYLAGIPRCAAYCRENPYDLISHWVPDHEPYTYIIHQVERDLQLVRSIGAETKNSSLRLVVPPSAFRTLRQQLVKAGMMAAEKYIILHAGVSEEKRKYPDELWIETGRLLFKERGIRLVLTGTLAERSAIEKIANGIGPGALNLCGNLSLAEFSALIDQCTVLVSVNTGTVHLAAALGKRLVVLYARTNPQHLPWMVPYRMLDYSVPAASSSKNQVIRYVNEQYYQKEVSFPSPEEVVNAVKLLLVNSVQQSSYPLQH